MNTREYPFTVFLFLAWFVFLGFTYLEQRGSSRGKLQSTVLAIQWWFVCAFFFNIIARLKFFGGQSELYAGVFTIIFVVVMALHCRKATELPKQTRMIGMAVMMSVMVLGTIITLMLI